MTDRTPEERRDDPHELYCPQCGHDGAFDSQGQFTTDVTVTKSSVRTEKEQHWHQMRCPACGTRFRVFEGETVIDKEALIPDGGQVPEDHVNASGERDSSSGIGQLTIHLNGVEHTIPTTVETEADILRAVDLDPAGYRLYRDEDVETLGPEQLVGEVGQTHLTDLVVVSDGDEFVAVPRYTEDGG